MPTHWHLTYLVPKAIWKWKISSWFESDVAPPSSKLACGDLGQASAKKRNNPSGFIIPYTGKSINIPLTGNFDNKSLAIIPHRRTTISHVQYIQALQWCDRVLVMSHHWRFFWTSILYQYLHADVVSFTTCILVWFITICSAQRKKPLGMDSMQFVISMLKDSLTFICIYPGTDFFFINASIHIFAASSSAKILFDFISLSGHLWPST